jgi:hypothetical protein
MGRRYKRNESEDLPEWIIGFLLSGKKAKEAYEIKPYPFSFSVSYSCVELLIQ